MDSHASVWRLSWADGLPRFGVGSRIGVVDPYSSMWPLKVGCWTPMHPVGLPSSLVV